ncbi:regulatory protein RecX [Kitasatospora indigofera]|uniref:regulatory protein RecX n=2 Tax=Kitasatospora indigofera TaxID=67307 RepID=UPI0036534063
MHDTEEYQPRPGSGGSPPGPGEPDAASGTAGDWGPADWCAGGGGNAADGPAAEDVPADDGRAARPVPTGAALRSLGAVLAPASELPGGRRRRRSALEEESGPAGADARDIAPATPSRGRAAAGRGAGRQAFGRPAPGRPPFGDSEADDGPEGDAGQLADERQADEHDREHGGRSGGRRSGGRRQKDRSAGEREPAAARREEPADPAGRARDICLRLLTGTAKTRKQLADALRKREIPDEVAEEVLTRLEEVGLIDDAAYADAWVESRHAARGLARRALAQELRTRGVAGDLVEQAMARLGPDEEAEAARALVERKLRATKGLEPQARTRRLVGMLARRGYSEGLAYRVVREALGEEDDGPGTDDW